MPALRPALAAQEDEGKLFKGDASPPCAMCHTLKDAGAEGAVGSFARRTQARCRARGEGGENGIGQMPAFPQLTEAQMQALARYIEQATR